MKILKLGIILFIFILIGQLMPVNLACASSTDGTIDLTYKYAWTENGGWLNFGTSEGNVHISDSALTGYAYGENIGWVSLNCSNDDSCGTADYKVSNDGEGNLSGYAWNENAGWIDFDPPNGGVSINSSGDFSGYAYGENIGWIVFNCATTNSCSTVDYKVKTDYRPRSARPECNNAIDDDNDGKIDYPADPGCESLTDTSEIDIGGSGWPVGAFNPPASPAITVDAPAGFSVVIQDGSEYTASREVILKLNGGADAEKMSISNSSDFQDASQENYQTSKTWTLTEGEGEKIVYVKFFTRYGVASPVVSASIIYKIAPASSVEDLSQKESELPAGPAEQLPMPGVKPPAEKEKIDSSAGKVVEKAVEILKSLVPEFLKPKPSEVPLEELIPKEAPPVMKGEWALLSQESINNFALTPLPEELSLLLAKFPELEKTFAQLGVNKITDLDKLEGVKLILPGLTASLGLTGGEGLNGEIVLSGGIPLSELPQKAKDKIPMGIVFAKSAGELIDFNMELTISPDGEPQNKITVISGHTLSLLVKPEGEVNGVKGYIIYKGKTGDIGLTPKVKTNILSKLAIKPVLAEEGQSSGNSSIKEERLVLSEFNYFDDDKDGIYTAEIQTPAVSGKYEIITEIDHKDQKLGKKEIKLITVVDPEGYVYEKYGDKEIRLPDAVVSLFWLNPENKNYELWPLDNFQQENPQTTDITGRYSFLVPPGQYYLKTEAPGYSLWQGEPFLVKEGSNVHFNIEMKAKYGWLKVVDWKIILMIIFGVLLLYNFYRDRKRTG